MSDFLKQFGQWGMVAGAAEGLGAAFCVELGRRGMNVILVDFNEKGMESLAKRLESEHKIKTRQLFIDLAAEEAPGRCLEAMSGLDCRLLVYNAAYSRVKPFLSAEPSELDLYIDVNTRTPLKLVYLFANHLKSGRNPGGILLMSSIAGLWGTRFVAAYSGTKAFNLQLAQALSFELKPYGISVSACCAGATATPGYLGSNPARGFLTPSVMNPANVASIAIKDLGKKTMIIPGLMNRISYFLLTRIIPNSISAKIVNRAMARTYRNLF